MLVNIGGKIPMDSVLTVVKCLLHGIKDSVFGLWPVYHLMRRNLKLRKQIFQCFLLNGVILLLSILMFDYLVLPLIQSMASVLYSFISNPSDSGVLSWLGTVLWYIFTGFWVLPIFWISKPINSIWFQDIATTAFEETRRREVRGRRHNSGQKSLSQNVSRFIADMLFSVVLEAVFLAQAALVGFVPGVGNFLSILHMAMLYALYSFEYRWINEGLVIHQRVAILEKEWPYFLGYGLPLALATTLTGSVFISACIFGILFPFVLVSVNYATPAQTTGGISQVPVFAVAVVFCNRIFNRSRSPALGKR